MNSSASTPRIRLTQALYALVLAAVALGEGRIVTGMGTVLMQSLGFALVAVAVLARIWISAFIAGRKEAQLVREGPFAVCRHPLYLCSIAAALGIGLSSGSVVLSLVLPLLVAAIVRAAARREDAALLARHGSVWRQYQQAVPAFWPARLRQQPPATLTIHPAIFMKSFVDAAAFLLLWLLVAGLDALRASGAWPALFRLP